MSNAPFPPLAERLREAGIIDEARLAALQATTRAPWWLALLLGFAAWIAATMIMSSFFVPLLAFGSGPVARGVGGLLLAAASAFLFRLRKPFTDQMALAFSLAGQSLFVSAFAERFFDLVEGADVLSLAALAASLAMAAIPATTLHRSACALIALFSLAWLIGAGTGLALFGIALAGAAVALWLARPAWAAHPKAPLVKAVAHALTLAALVLAPYGHAHSALTALEEALTGYQTGFVLPVYRIGAALVLLATTAWLCRDTPSLRLPALAGALLFALAAHPAPGLLVAVAVLLAVFHASHRPWIAMTLVFATLYLGELYYSLQDTLLVKSIALIASGAVLLALRTLLRARARRIA
ncbi:DUF4401 domain-containing protein [Aromatoleum evansii]|uniref:DUF4401 domain-containing protein n=1 Tax=Aromatoleum evansii TaxID=59406 RepID=UPI00145C7665|nr:DUF4401 domain-containing protein [Aromatoleum evansii]NMG30737.1 DUF4401 domain-containing protein [Aromatoleum evansii]